MSARIANRRIEIHTQPHDHNTVTHWAYLGRGVDSEAATSDKGLDGASLDELLNELASERAVDLVGFDQVVKSDHLKLGGGRLHGRVIETLGEDDAVDLLLAKLGLGPLL